MLRCQRRPAEFTEEMWSRFAEVYESPHDIELFPGGISELPVAGGVVGPTLACLVAEQFARIMRGDRSDQNEIPLTSWHHNVTVTYELSNGRTGAQFNAD